MSVQTWSQRVSPIWPNEMVRVVAATAAAVVIIGGGALGMATMAPSGPPRTRHPSPSVEDAATEVAATAGASSIVESSSPVVAAPATTPLVSHASAPATGMDPIAAFASTASPVPTLATAHDGVADHPSATVTTAAPSLRPMTAALTLAEALRQNAKAGGAEAAGVGALVPGARVAAPAVAGARRATPQRVAYHRPAPRRAVFRHAVRRTHHGYVRRWFRLRHR